MEEARRAVSDLETLASTVCWRSRSTGTEYTGATFDPTSFPPGDHIVGVTAVDKRGHVAQALVHLHVEAAPAGGDEWGSPPPDDGQKR